MGRYDAHPCQSIYNFAIHFWVRIMSYKCQWSESMQVFCNKNHFRQAELPQKLRDFMLSSNSFSPISPVAFTSATAKKSYFLSGPASLPILWRRKENLKTSCFFPVTAYFRIILASLPILCKRKENWKTSCSFPFPTLELSFTSL